MVTSNGLVPGLPDPSKGPVGLPNETFLQIVEELREDLRCCRTCNQLTAIWRSESDFVRMSLVCHHFNNVLRTYEYTPRTTRGNTLVASFPCSCILARLTARAAPVEVALPTQPVVVPATSGRGRGRGRRQARAGPRNAQGSSTSRGSTTAQASTTSRSSTTPRGPTASRGSTTSRRGRGSMMSSS